MTVLPWAVAQAQIPGKQMVSGQVWPMLVQVDPTNSVGAWCFVGRGLSIFEASADGSDAVISLPEVFYFDGAAYYLSRPRPAGISNSDSHPSTPTS
jgi:hypothetical protein